MQRALRRADTLEPELLKLGEVKPVEDVVREVAVYNGHDKEGFRETEDGRRRQPLHTADELELL